MFTRYESALVKNYASTKAKRWQWVDTTLDAQRSEQFEPVHDSLPSIRDTKPSEIQTLIFGGMECTPSPLGIVTTFHKTFPNTSRL